MSDKKEKLIITKGERDEQSLSDVRNMYDGVHTSVEAIKTSAKAGAETVHYTVKSIGHIRTGTARAVRGGRKLMTAVKNGNAGEYLNGKIKTAVKTTAKGVAVGTVKTAVNVGKSGLGRTRDTLLEQKIDRSKVTDMGIEAVKQGLTYVREGDNARKVAKNAYTGAKNTVRTIKNTPQNIRKAIDKTRKTAKKITRIARSKVFWIVALAAAGILIVSNIMNSAASFVMTSVSGTFGWLAGEDDDDDSDEKKQIEKYIKIIQKEVENRQEEIDDVYYDFECDRFNYGDREEITEFRDMYFDYGEINLNTQDRYIKAISIAAAKWYFKHIDEDELDDEEEEEINLSLKKSELRDTVDYFYDFEYGYKYDYCPHWSCCKYSDYIMVSGDVDGRIFYDSGYYDDNYRHGCEQISEWVDYDHEKADFDWENVHETNRSFCVNPDHEYLTGGVTNYSDSQVLDNADLTEEEKAMYEMYCEQITEWLSE